MNKFIFTLACYNCFTIANAQDSYSPQVLTTLDDKVQETSGLIFFNDTLWTHNDSGGKNAIYAIDTLTGAVMRKVIIANAKNIDWEDIAQDESYVYIGDFGNNFGNRRDLKIYKIAKNDIKAGNDSVTAQTIAFYYPEQKNFSSQLLATNYDCEALISQQDSLYLFTKNWKNSKSYLYALPKNEGNFAAVLKDSLNVKGLITGAGIELNLNTICLTGYTTVGQQFTLLLYQYAGSNFFSGLHQRVNLNIPGSQTEGVAAIGNHRFVLSTEKTNFTAPKIFEFPAHKWLNITGLKDKKFQDVDIKVYPNPAQNKICLKIVSKNIADYQLALTDLTGKLIDTDNIIHSSELIIIDIRGLKDGLYFLHLQDNCNNRSVRKVIISNT